MVERNHLRIKEVTAFLLVFCDLKMYCSVLNKCYKSNSDKKFASEIFLRERKKNRAAGTQIFTGN